MSEQDDGGGLPDPFDDDGIEEAPPEVAALMEKALESLTRREPMGSACPNCGSTDTSLVTIGDPDGEEFKDGGGWTVVVLPEVFLSYCECSACDDTWQPEQA